MGLALLLALLAAPAAVLQGTVKGPDGKPIEDAVVVVRAANAAWGERARTTRTIAGGAFRIELAKHEDMSVWVQAPGLALAKIEKPALTRPLVITLKTGLKLSGVVRDGNSGQPIEGAIVTAQPSWQLAPPDVASEPGLGRLRVRSDAGGRFQIEGLPQGRPRVGAAARGYARTDRNEVSLATPLELFLFPGGSIVGTVLGPDGGPVNDAVVIARKLPRWESPPAERTDKRGAYELLGVQAGVYDVVATTPGLAPGLARRVSVERDQEVRVDLRLVVGSTLVGRIVDTEDNPVAASIRVEQIDGEPAPGSLVQTMSGEALADGAFQIDDLPSGAIVLQISPSSRAPRQFDVDVRSEVPWLDVGEIVVETGLAIQGRIKDRTGLGIANARVSGYRTSGQGSGSWPATISDDAGAYAVAGLEAGRYRLDVQADGFAPAKADFETGARNADIVMERAGTITGEVLDPAGLAIEEYGVWARRLDLANTQEEVWEEEPVADSFNQPRFSLAGVGPGRWAIEAVASGYAPAKVTDVVVRPGASTDVGRIRLTAGGLVRGIVVTGNNEPVAGATVEAEQDVRYGYGRAFNRAETDVNGAFEIRGLEAGKFDVVATHPAYARAAEPAVEVDPKTPADVRLVMSSGGRIQGTARGRDGSPVPGQIRVWPQETSGRSTGGYPLVTVGPDGTFSAERVPPGMTRLILMTQSGTSYRSVADKEVEVREGETAVVDFDLRGIVVSGTVTRAAGPVAGLRLRIGSSGGMYTVFWGEPTAADVGPKRGEAVVGGDGRYEMIVDSAGSQRARVTSADERTTMMSREVEIPDAETYTLDFDLRGAAVTGLVVDSETDAPIAGIEVTASEQETDENAGSSETDGAGRFQFELELGGYALETEGKGYTHERLDLTVTASGASELRIEMRKGLGLSGRVIDPSGTPVAGIEIVAAASGETGSAMATSIADGSFRFEGLLPTSYNLSAGSELQGFAFADSLTPGATEVTLVLRPPGRARLQLMDTAGNPVRNAYARLVSIGTARFARYLGPLSDVQGVLELGLPVGVVGLEIGNRAVLARVTLTIDAVQIATADVMLSPRPKRPN